MSERLLLVINCGSSSLKFGLFRNGSLFDENGLHCLAEGIAEALASDSALLKCRFNDVEQLHELPGANHQQALEMLLGILEPRFTLSATLQE